MRDATVSFVPTLLIHAITQREREKNPFSGDAWKPLWSLNTPSIDKQSKNIILYAQHINVCEVGFEYIHMALNTYILVVV